MLFLRSPGGISHHPDETVLEEDVAAALEVCAQISGAAGRRGRIESGNGFRGGFCCIPLFRFPFEEVARAPLRIDTQQPEGRPSAADSRHICSLAAAGRRGRGVHHSRRAATGRALYADDGGVCRRRIARPRARAALSLRSRRQDRTESLRESGTSSSPAAMPICRKALRTPCALRALRALL